MTHYNFDSSLKSILDQLTNQKISIFCGAGISYNSGLPVVYNFLEAIFNKFELSDEEKSIIHNTEFPFEAFIEMLQEECETDELLKIFKDGRYNTNHLLIAHLIKNNVAKNIITTNFDEQIEKACLVLDLKESVHYNVYRVEHEFKDIDWKSDLPNLIKIHGCSSDLKSMAINMRMVANQTDSTNRNNVVRNFFNRKLNPVIFIIGYSCSDVFDISPIIERIKDQQSEVLLLEHIFVSEEYKIENLTKQQHKNPFQLFKEGKRIFFSADMFIEKLWKTLRLNNYSFIKHDKTNWQQNIDRWYDIAVNANSKAFKYHVCSRLFYNIGYYALSEQHYNKGIAIAYELREYKTAASEIGNLGMNYNALGKYSEAKMMIKTSLDLYRRLGDTEGEIIHLQNLGNIYRNEGDYAEAERLMLSSVKLAQTDGTASNICKGLGNLALVYNLTHEYEKAAECAERGMAIANKLGIKQSESSQLATIAQAYFGMGNMRKAIELYKESVKITRQMKDRRNESGALINLAGIYTELGEFQKSIDCLLEGLRIAIDLGTIQIEGLAYFSMGNNYRSISNMPLALLYFQKALVIFDEIYPENHPHLLAARKMVTDLGKF
ncbi:tetratricopeptide repeat protein [Pedobacter panaciterrae]|uniref:tetratricopeptide repeat protein n=1 Tax=Pedobacter panaciterrae TaxID=363849 RepID=UPI0025996A0E|nr:tetratricopeptide repeat protein [uncultured Pedobacter sp.]